VQWGDEPVAAHEPEPETVEENPEEAEPEASLEEEAAQVEQETSKPTPEPEETVTTAAKSSALEHTCIHAQLIIASSFLPSKLGLPNFIHPKSSTV